MALEFSLLILTRNCHQESVTPVNHTKACRPLLNTRLSLLAREQLPGAPPGARSGSFPREDGVLYLDGFLVWLLCKVVDSQHLLLLWEGHREVQEGVKGDGYLQM